MCKWSYFYLLYRSWNSATQKCYLYIKADLIKKKLYRWLIYENVTQTIYRWKWIELLPAHTRDITVNYLHFCCQCDSAVIYIQRIKNHSFMGWSYNQVYVIKSIIKTLGLFDVIDYVTTVMTIPVKVKERYLIKRIISFSIIVRTIKIFDIFRLYLSRSVQFSSLSTVSCTAYHYNKYKQFTRKGRLLEECGRSVHIISTSNLH